MEIFLLLVSLLFAFYVWRTRNFWLYEKSHRRYLEMSGLTLEESRMVFNSDREIVDVLTENMMYRTALEMIGISLSEQQPQNDDAQG